MSRKITVLYKYRPFDQWSFDMLEKKYLYLSPYNKLDDKSEFKITIDEENYYDLVNGTLGREAVEQILLYIKPYTSEENFQICRNAIYRIMTPKFEIRNSFLMDFSLDLERLAPEVPKEEIAALVNRLLNIPEMINKSNITPVFKNMLSLGINAREKIGICSLSESPNIEEMWKSYYTNNGAGYCVEYDFSDYPYLDSLFPVAYEDFRQTNVVIQVVATLVGEMINSFSNNQAQADTMQFVKLFTTKDKDWKYQKEWRLIGDANNRVTSPRVKRIIVGSKSSPSDINSMTEFCSKNDIILEIRKNS